MCRFFGFDGLVKVGLNVLAYVSYVVLDVVYRGLNVLNLFFPAGFELVRSLPELSNTFTKRLSKLRELLRPKDQKCHNKNHYHLGDTKVRHLSSCNRRQ